MTVSLESSFYCWLRIAESKILWIFDILRQFSILQTAQLFNKRSLTQALLQLRCGRWVTSMYHFWPQRYKIGYRLWETLSDFGRSRLENSRCYLSGSCMTPCGKNYNGTGPRLMWRNQRRPLASMLMWLAPMSTTKWMRMTTESWNWKGDYLCTETVTKTKFPSAATQALPICLLCDLFLLSLRSSIYELPPQM